VWPVALAVSTFLLLPPYFGFWDAEESRFVWLITVAIVAVVISLNHRHYPLQIYSFDPRRPSFWASALVLWMLASWWMAKLFPIDGYHYFFGLLAALTFLAMTWWNEKAVDRTLCCLLVLQASLVLWQMLGEDPMALLIGKTNITVNRAVLAETETIHYAWGSLGNETRTAAWVALALPAAILSRHVPSWGKLSGLVAGGFVLVVMHSLIAYLAVVFGILAVLVSLKVLSFRMSALAILAFLAAFGMLAFQHGETAQRRAMAWKAAFWHMKHSPNSPERDFVLGKGVNSFKNLEIYEAGGPDAKRIGGKFVIWKKAHNEFLQVFIESGVPGLVFLVGLFVTALYISWLYSSDVVTFASVAILGVIAMGLFPFREPTMALVSLSIFRRVLNLEERL